MRLQDLISIDPTIKLIHPQEWPGELLAISALDDLQSQSIIFIKNAKFLKKFEAKLDEAKTLKIGVIVDEKFFGLMGQESKTSLQSLPWIATSPNVALSLTLLSKPFYDLKMKGLNTQVDGRQMGTTEIDPTAMIAQNVFIGENVKIGAGVEIMPGSVIMPMVEIGAGTKIYPNVTIYPFSKIGKNCRFHSGTVIGSDGFGYTFHQGKHLKIWHTGGVVIHDDVEIGSNSSVDMGTFSPTIIGEGTRIDNFVQIAHNCKIGKGCVLCGSSGMAGSATLEDYVVIAGKAGIGPDAYIGKGTQVAGSAMVTDGDIWAPGSIIAGHPARDYKEWMKGLAYVRKLSLQEKSKES